MCVRSSYKYVLLAIAALIGGATPAVAQNPFAAVGPMQAARALHTATTLADGSVLIAGGEDRRNFFESLSSAEIYDPVTNTFTLVPGVMQIGRAQHTATLLASGRVLLAGGENEACCRYNGNYGDRPTEKGDVYDPVSRTFAATSDMSVPRYNHAATRLSDGRVLITGGVGDINFSVFHNTAEIYDPVTNTFSPTGNMTVARYSHASVLLADGKVLVVGGSQSSTSAEVYDPATGTFTATANPAVATRTPRAFALGDGSVIIFGHDRNVQRFDSTTQTFTAMPASLFPHGYWAAIVLLGDERVLLADDFQSEIYDPATGASVSAGDPGVGELFPAGATLNDGRALITGGETFVPYTFVSQTLASVFSPNAAPVADAGADRQVTLGDNCTASLTLDGSLSSDPDADTLTYTWSLSGNTLGTGATLPINLPAGTHVITLRVNDGRGGESSDTVAITVADTTPPLFTVPAPVTLEQASLSGTPFTPVTPAATDNCTASPTVTIAGVPAGNVFPAGTTTLTYAAVDDAGNETVASTTVTVRDTIAPAILDVTPSVRILWPVNHRMVDVTFAVDAADASSVAPTCRVTGVTSSEPASDAGDTSSPDWAVTGPLAVQLRAERLGKGSGRIYTVAVQCTDASGNVATATSLIDVPHDRRK